MRAGVVGAGVSGIAAARALAAVGIQTTVWEAAPDIGGVWSATRRYPGVSTQNDKQSYSFSDRGMPAHYPDYPGGEEIQRYLLDYATANGVRQLIELRTRVLAADLRPDGRGWTVQVDGPGGLRTEEVDWLLLANGICSMPHVPDLPGNQDFTRAGGVMLSPSQVGAGQVLDGRDVVVLGWGKSAADLAVASLGRARSVTMVARNLGWKLPKQIGRFSFQQLVLTRLGEHIIWGPHRSLLAGAVQRLDAPLRAVLLHRIEGVIRRELDLERRGLVPRGSLREVTHLVTPGFFEAIDTGAIQLKAGQNIAALGKATGRPAVQLTDGGWVAADVVIAATGYDQDLSVLAPAVQDALLGERAEMQLYRHTLPAEVPRLAFVGWMNSFRSPIGAEVQALWIAAVMLDLATLPSARRRRRATQRYQLSHSRAADKGVQQFSAGANISDLDAWIGEAGLRLPRRIRLAEWLRPLDPADYRGLLAQLQHRAAAVQSVSAVPRNGAEMTPLSDDQPEGAQVPEG